jgi:hypothetical protein
LDERITTVGELESGSMGISDMVFITKKFQLLLYLKVTSFYLFSFRCFSGACPSARKTFSASPGQQATVR